MTRALACRYKFQLPSIPQKESALPERTPASFDLRTEPWLPVLDASGRSREVSLRELFAEAPRLRSIATAFGPERVALTRLLVAVLLSAIEQPETLEAAVAMLDGHDEFAPLVADYLDTQEGAFDLFHADRPFLQLAPLPETKRTTVAALVLGWSSGNNVTLSDHHVDAVPPALTPAEAARALLTTLLYQPGGGVAKPFNRTDSPGTKPLMALLETESLWDTIVANTPRAATDSERAAAWEAPERQPSRDGTTADGLLDRLTWQSRRVKLDRDADGLVRWCTINQHLKLADGSLHDPYVPTKIVDDEQRIIRMNPGRRLWRSADSVLNGVSGRESAANLGTELLARAGRSNPTLLVVGLQVDQAKIGDAQSASLPISAALLGDEDRIAMVRIAIEQAAQGEFAITRGFERYVSELRELRLNAKTDENSVKLPKALGLEARALASPFHERYWGVLSARFPLFMEQLAAVAATPQPGEPPASNWAALVADIATRTIDPLLESPGPYGHDQAAAGARNTVRRHLVQQGLLAKSTRPKEAA
jgi:CRISPR type I-E-associated protein CasA/Cse1